MVNSTCAKFLEDEENASSFVEDDVYYYYYILLTDRSRFLSRFFSYTCFQNPNSQLNTNEQLIVRLGKYALEPLCRI